MSTTSPRQAVSTASAKYLTVMLDHEAYGIAVLKVREIIRLQKITPVPQLPAFIKGVINLRGRVIPVIDLRVRFGLTAEFTERTCIIVVQIRRADQETVQIGLIVDSVDEVINLPSDDIEPPPEFGVQVDTSYVLGMAMVNGGVKTILDIDRVVAPETLGTIAAIARTPRPAD